MNIDELAHDEKFGFKAMLTTFFTVVHFPSDGSTPLIKLSIEKLA